MEGPTVPRPRRAAVKGDDASRFLSGLQGDVDSRVSPCLGGAAGYRAQPFPLHRGPRSQQAAR